MNSHRIRPLIVAVAIAATTLGCESGPDATMEAAVEHTALSSNVESDEVEIVVLGQGRYMVDGQAVLDVDLAKALEAAANARQQARRRIVLYVPAHLDKEIRGYNVNVALNEATDAGFLSARAIDNYDPSPEGREGWKPLPSIDLVERRANLPVNAERSDSVTAH